QSLLQQRQHVEADLQGQSDPCGMEHGGVSLVHGLSLLHAAAGAPPGGTLGTSAERWHEDPAMCKVLDRVDLGEKVPQRVCVVCCNRAKNGVIVRKSFGWRQTRTRTRAARSAQGGASHSRAPARTGPRSP